MMKNRELLILKFQILGLSTRSSINLALASKREYTRDGFGRFASDPSSGIGDVDELMNSITPQAAKENCKKTLAQIDQSKQAVLEAFEVNPEIAGKIIVSGIYAPDPIANFAVNKIKGKKENITSKDVLDFVGKMNEEDVNKAVIDFVFEDNSAAKIAASIGNGYLEYKKDLENLKHLESQGETEWVAQVGRMGAYGIEISQALTEMGAKAILPETFAASASTAVLSKAIQSQVIKTGTIEGATNLAEKIFGISPGKAASLYLGAEATSGVLNDISKQAQLEPQKLKQIVADYGINYSSEKASKFCENVGSGLDNVLKSQNTDGWSSEKILDEVYTSFSPGNKKIADSLLRE
jgi:hypothetical protein